MTHFSFTVDTVPMANSIDGVSHHVDGTTAAVVAMQTAVIIAEQKGTDKICGNVNYGFYSLIRSQISQKIVKEKSIVDAKIMELEQQSISLASIKSRMEKDFNMLANRYTKLFTTLNKELRSRIFELDKPTTNFITKDIYPSANRTKQLSASPSVTQLESITSSQVISVSNTKYNALRNISSMQEFIFNSEKQKKLISTILFKESIKQPVEKIIPIVITESEGLNVRHSQWMISQPIISKNMNTKIESHIYSVLTNLNWIGNDGTEINRIKQEFGNILSNSTLSDRIKKQMVSLLDSSNWQNLSKS